MSTEIKVFRMNDCDWVAASTLEEAKAFYLEQVGAGEDELDDPTEETGMDHLRFRDEDGAEVVTRTFREQLSLLVGRGTTFPDFFASTEW